MAVQMEEAELARLREKAAILDALIAGGVKDWDGYEAAVATVAELPADDQSGAPEEDYELD